MYGGRLEGWEDRQASCFTCSRWSPSWSAWTYCSSGTASDVGTVLVFAERKRLLQRTGSPRITNTMEATDAIKFMKKVLPRAALDGPRCLEYSALWRSHRRGAVVRSSADAYGPACPEMARKGRPSH